MTSTESPANLLEVLVINPSTLRDIISKTSHCRFCAQEKNCVDLLDLSVDKDSLHLFTTILEFFKIDYVDLSHSRIPKTSCEMCHSMMQKCYSFFLTVKVAQTILNKLYSSQEMKTDNISTISESLQTDNFDDTKVFDIDNHATNQEKDSVNISDQSDVETDTENPNKEEEIKVIYASNIQEKNVFEDVPEQTEFSVDQSDVKTSIKHAIEIEIKFENTEQPEDSDTGVGTGLIDESECSSTLSVHCLSKQVGKDSKEWQISDVFSKKSSQSNVIDIENSNNKQDHTITKEVHNIINIENQTNSENGYTALNLLSKLEPSRYYKKQKHYQDKLKSYSKRTPGCDNESTFLNSESESDLRPQFNKKPVCNTKLTTVREECTWKSFPWYCRICQGKFDTFEDLRIHSKVSHDQCETFKCIDCKTFMTHEFIPFIEHVKKHRKELRTRCHYCDEIVEENLEKHVEGHIGTHLPCPACGELLSDDESLQQHQKDYVKIRKKPDPKRKTPATIEELTCQICKNIYCTIKSLKQHIQDCHAKSELKTTFICEQCGKSYPKKGTLKLHQKSHDQGYDHICLICNKSFVLRSKLKMHLKTHINAKPFSCDTCGRCFKKKVQLKEHMIIHIDSLPYVCQYCNKKFRRPGALKLHERVHTGHKPYKCKHCEKEFTNWPNLNKHSKRRHNINLSLRKCHLKDKLSIGSD